MRFKKESAYILDEGLTPKHFIADRYNTQDVNIKMRKAHNRYSLASTSLFKLDIFKMQLYLIVIADAQVGLKCTKMLLEESKSGTVCK